MDLQAIQAREELKVAQADLTAANAAIQNAPAGASRAELSRLEAGFNQAAAATAQAKTSYEVECSRARLNGRRINVREDLTYTPRKQGFFRDLMASREGNLDASQRLQAHTRELEKEMGRTQFDLNSTDATGGHLVAPLYLQEEFITLARAGMPTVNAIGPRDLPPSTDTVIIPRMSTGTAVATQSSDNAAVQETDASFDNVTADVKTIAGMQDVSRQVVDRGTPGTDEVIFGDLAKAYATLLDSQVINSSTANNLGLLNVTGANTVTYTSATPTVVGLYPKLADAIQRIHSTVYTAATAMFMHPRRWGWILAALDSQNRPLITPYAPANAAGAFDGVVAQGLVGSIQGVPIYVDANIPSTLGASTNEDRIIITATPELYVWTDPSGPYLEVYPDVGSGTLTVRLRAHNYWAQNLVRRGAATSILSGTGLSAPSW